MNLHRSFFALVLTFFVLSGLAAETVIDQLYGLRKYELADAYWAAGQRFADLGQADRAAEFKAEALHVFPGFVPGKAPTASNSAVPVAAPQMPSPEVIKEKNLQGEKIARLQFQKLLRGYLTSNTATVLSVLAASVEIQGQPTSPDAVSVGAFLQAHPAEAGAPDELFLLDSLDAIDGTGQSVVVTVKANPDAPAGLAEVVPFWKDKQTYTFDRVADTWKLVKVTGN